MRFGIFDFWKWDSGNGIAGMDLCCYRLILTEKMRLYGLYLATAIVKTTGNCI